MCTCLILREKAHRFNADTEIKGSLKDLRSGSVEKPPTFADLRKASFDWGALARRKLRHERLDQLTQELLLGEDKFHK